MSLVRFIRIYCILSYTVLFPSIVYIVTLVFIMVFYSVHCSNLLNYNKQLTAYSL